MKRRLFALGQTQVTMHLATPLFALYMLLGGHGQLLLMAMGSILLHELGHALCAVLCGQPPLELEITPLGCLLRLEDEAALPSVKRLLTILAGPLTTALLCLLALRLTGAGLLAREMGRLLLTANAALLVLNLVPAMPLDGGRMLALVLGLLLPAATVRRVMRGVSTAAGLVLIGLNAAVCLRYGGWNLSLMCAGCFMIYAGSVTGVTAAMQQLQMLMDRKSRMETRGLLPAAVLAVMTTTPIRTVVNALHPTRYTELLLLEPGTLRLAGRVPEDQLIAAYLASPGEKCRIFIKAVDK